MSPEFREQESLAQRQVRAAENQSLFREVNERIEELRPPSTFVEFVCECSTDPCNEMVELTQQEYAALRSDPNRFAVSPGHVVPEAENVVDRTDRYEIVAKLGAGVPVAERLDPRRRRRHLNSVPDADH
jgi:hypothetical protein